MFSFIQIPKFLTSSSGFIFSLTDIFNSYSVKLNPCFASFPDMIIRQLFSEFIVCMLLPVL